MTSVLAEAVRELAAALGQPYDVDVVDTGISGGEWFVGGERALTTTACHVVILGCDRALFKDHVAAMLYLRVLGVRDET